MPDLKTIFMGIELRSPVVVGASSLSRRVDNIKAAEEAGAGALVIYSLFQEQIEQETWELDEALSVGSDRFAESLTYFPHIEHSGPREHIMWVEKTRKAVEFPLIGSLNATSVGNWIDYARQLESAGCNALELNLYSVETDPTKTAEEIEKRSLDVIATVKSHVRIPVAVKLSPFYTSMANFAQKAVEAGANGLVLFNRFLQPTIDPDSESIKLGMTFSTPEEQRLPLRWVAILSGQINADLAAGTGVHSGKDVVSQLLAGAKAVQTASALLINGINHIATMNREIAEWMDTRGYSSIEDFRGKLSQSRVSDPYAYERAQYVKLLLSRK
ncbi:MAG: dihydroorotate dehydrogenase-like protein [Armatimonadetes bacterium]|nr:dihydroorotate dehydrogenase-like protein [Armatimonadota bacterium]